MEPPSPQYIKPDDWRNKWWQVRRYVIAFWAVIFLFIIGVSLFMFGVSKGMLGALPTFDELENPRSNLATEIYSADSVLLGKFYKENRSNITFDELSPNVVNALLATEDIRFYEHSGIDFRGLFRAFTGVLTLNSKGGASTITQQLAKNLFHEHTSSKVKRLVQKLKEWIIAVRLERSYTKEEIMAMYLNTVEFNDNSFGIKSAARTYFNKKPSELNVEEAAVLVGMLQAPSTYNPRTHPVTSKKRRDVVLSQMLKYNKIDRKAYDLLSSCPIELNYKDNSHTEGLATYFREYLRQWLAQWVKDNPKIDGTKYDIYKDGLKIFTTLDSRLQEHAEKAMLQHMKELQGQFFDHWKDKDIWKNTPEDFHKLVQHCNRYQIMEDDGQTDEAIMKELAKPVRMKVFTYHGEIDTVMSPIDSIRYHRMMLQAGIMGVNPVTGFVKVWVGGVNYKYFQYDHVTSQRQIGSTFKPFIYATAIDNGYSPCYQILDAPVTFENYHNWTPQNSDNKFTNQLMTLKQCLAKSQNSCSAYLMKQIGPAMVIDMAKNRLGITSHIDTVPSICLGTPDISLFEMVGAYTAFANKGIHTRPVFVKSMTDKDGNEIYHTTSVTNEAMSEEKAYVMIDLLRNVVNHGTAGRLRFKYKLTADMAGKTGTTQNQSDGWFIGMCPELILGVWTGGEDRIVRFRSILLGQGASMALPIYAYFFQRVYADPSTGYMQDTHFAAPEGGVKIEMDCSKYTHGDDNTNYGSEYE